MANVGFFIRRRLRFFRGLLLAVFLVVFGGRVGNATLILYVYHNGEIYAGADSLVTQTGGTNVLRINKIIPVTDTCNASIANSYGGFVISKIDGQTNLVFFLTNSKKYVSGSDQLKKHSKPRSSKLPLISVRFLLGIIVSTAHRMA